MVIVAITVFAVFVGAMVTARSLEKRDWNGGACRCGAAWLSFDVDSQGGRGYRCRGCRRVIWITYPFVDK